MAEKRMFTQQIIDSDAFLDMPLSAQALYFHLSMRADDDGFVKNPRKIQRMINAGDDDLRLLIAKRFVLIFESGVIVIKHWRLHNTLRKDRYKPTVFQDEFKRLELKSNGAYTERAVPVGCQTVAERLPDGCQEVANLAPVGCQMVASWLPQDRLGKDSLGKGSLGKERLGKENLSVNNKCKPVQTSTKQPELLRKFLDFGFLDESELEDPQWLDWLKSQWSTKEEYVDLKIRIDYVLTGISNYVQVGEDGNGKPLFRWRVSPEKLAGIANKSAWFTSAMEKTGKGTTDDGDEPF